MTDPFAPQPSRRNPTALLAVGAAVAAVAVAGVAVFVVSRREPAAATPAKASGRALDDGRVPALDVVELFGSSSPLAPVAGGMSVPKAAPALGLAAGDVVRSINGVTVHDAAETRHAFIAMALEGSEVLYLDLTRAGADLVVRRQIDGDLREARRQLAQVDPDPDPTASPASLPPSLQPDPPLPDPVADALQAALDAGITKIDDTHYEVDRALVDKVMANPMAMQKGARVVAAVKNGKPNGFKMYAIKPSSAYAKLGFSNGDTMLAINGFDLTSVDRALEMYTKIKDASSLEVDVERRGRRLTLNYRIR